MKSSTYYYFCHRCGSDTATLEPYAQCPYCHADGRWLVTVSQPGNEEADIVAQVLHYRHAWRSDVKRRSVRRFSRLVRVK